VPANVGAALRLSDRFYCLGRIQSWSDDRTGPTRSYASSQPRAARIIRLYRVEFDDFLPAFRSMVVATEKMASDSFHSRLNDQKGLNTAIEFSAGDATRAAGQETMPDSRFHIVKWVDRRQQSHDQSSGKADP
jgi:hypothetical protein